jgi:hypothetical protein
MGRGDLVPIRKNTLVRGYLSPLNYASDIEWLVIWLAIAMVMVVLAVTVKRATDIVF